MAKRPWLDEVRGRLAKHGLPPAYVQRFVQELSDHFDDLKEENMGTEVDVSSRLGEPERVAQAAVAAYRRRSFLGRHPTAAFLVFAVSPLLMLLATMVTSLVLLGLGFRLTGLTGTLLGCINADCSLAVPNPLALAVMPTVLALDHHYSLDAGVYHLLRSGQPAWP